MATKTYTFLLDKRLVNIDAISFGHARYKLVERYNKFDEPFPAVLVSINIEKELLERAKEQPGQLQTLKEST